MGSQDYGIIISQPGVSVPNATTGQITLNTAHPFIKIDTQNKVGFQTITLLITTNPPNPGAGNTTYTVLYFFPHGYTYIPSVEMLFFVSTPPPGTLFTMTYFQDSGQIAQTSNFGQAYLYWVADKTNVYIICEKIGGTDGVDTLLSGTNVLISTHVFVEDIGV